MRYLISTPWWVKRIFSSYVWDIHTKEKEIYLTFDDGPHPIATPFVLDELKKYNAKATFFCIGKNVVAYPNIYQRILDEGHAVGNHTQHHLNGWKTDNEKYLNDISEANHHIRANLFRPPYGRIKKSQARRIKEVMRNENAKIIMWSVLSADFDTRISPQQCFKNAVAHARPGSIIVFHDSEKAFPTIKESIPLVLHFLTGKGYALKKL